MLGRFDGSAPLGAPGPHDSHYKGFCEDDGGVQENVSLARIL